MHETFKDTCKYAECENKDNCVRYSETGAYDMKFICAEKDYKWMVNKGTGVIETNGDK